MSWTLLVAVACALGLVLAALVVRRRELARMRATLDERERAVEAGSAEATLQHPVVDLSRCLGCGTCVSSCPEDGVLELVHGQAMVVNGGRCVGHAACERECPVGAITITIARIEERRDVPVLTDALEAVGTPGLFLAGELTARALIKTAIEQGTSVAREVASRVAVHRVDDDELHELCIVGAGPAGLACALEARRLGVTCVVLEQESAAGGTVAKYPRKKLVVTQPVELPLHGTLERTSYEKEELVELWQRVADEQELPIRTGQTFEGVERAEDGTFVVRTRTHAVRARFVCLALGRRGSPNKLGVPGEERSKVAYALLDARSYAGRRVLVVGGGDSAVESALALAEQPGAEVTLSYRRPSFTRIRARNAERLAAAQAEGRLSVLFESEVRAIHEDHVELAMKEAAPSLVDLAAHARGSSAVALAEPGTRVFALANDDVFVHAGGTLPFALLESCGVSFDPTLRAPQAPIVEQGSGLVRAVGAAFALSVLALAFALWNSDYYALPAEARPADAKHDLLRPGRGLGLALGITAAALVVVNLLYLARRASWKGFTFGSLRAWMTSHVATGVLAVLLATLHSAMAPRDTVGGHALWALVVLFASGAVGRYFYACVPRAANGRELELAEVERELARQDGEWSGSQRAYSERVRAALDDLVAHRRWRSSPVGRVMALVTGKRELERVLARLADEGRRERVPEAQIASTTLLARRAHSTALAVAHFEDLRALLNGWRWIHRWVAALMVALLVLHVVYALTYGALLDGGAP